MDRSEMRKRVVEALLKVGEKDKALLAVSANERSITHKLAEYLQTAFPEYNVDCEYNRDGDDPKR